MPRTYKVNGETFTMTAQEETARDAEESLVASALPTEKVMQAKLEARTRILAIVPEWKQNNLNARMNELNKKVAIDGGTLNQAELNDITAMDVVWSQAKAIRVKSDALEASIGGMNTAQLQALNVKDESHWT
jgi:hypothetical protein